MTAGVYFVAGATSADVEAVERGESLVRPVEHVEAADIERVELAAERVTPPAIVEPEPEPPPPPPPEPEPEPDPVELPPAAVESGARLRERAREFVTRTLQAGPQPSGRMRAAIVAAGFSRSTGEAAARELGIVRRCGQWRLPGDDAVTPPTKRDKAERLILDLLSDGPRPFAEIAAAGERVGVGRSTMHSAARALGVNVRRSRVLHGPYQGGCPSTWSLPPKGGDAAA